MAALNRPTEATYITHEEVTVDTADREDHTFCGIMFPVKCKDLVPLDHVVIHSLAVRGRLGPLTVWVSKEEATTPSRGFRMNPKFWEKIYERTHGPSIRNYVELDLRSNPIYLKPGQTRAIYIHSTLPGDEAIVYDNRHSRRTYDDALVSILTGRAHVSTRAFGTNPIWGWGNPWRDHREFVGRLEYGAVFRLWNPTEFLNFGTKFQTAARTLFLCQRRWESQLSRLPDECIFYILNMCRWDWFNETPKDMKALRKKNKARAAAAAAAAAEARMEIDSANVTAVASVAAAVSQANESSSAEEESGGVSCCIRRSHQERGAEESNVDGEEEEDDDEEYHAARQDEDSSENEDEFLEEADDDDDELPEESLPEDSDDDDVDWDSDDDYRADNDVFEVEDDSDDDDDEDVTEASGNQGNRAWIHRQFARIHVLQAMAALDDNGVDEMNH